MLAAQNQSFFCINLFLQGRRPVLRHKNAEACVQLVQCVAPNGTVRRNTVHYLRWRMPPFMRQCWGLPHRLAQCMRPQGWGELVNATLLSLINEACVNVCCATLLSNELVCPACVQTRSSNPRGRECRPSRKGLGEDRILSDVVHVYLYCPTFSVSVYLGV